MCSMGPGEILLILGVILLILILTRGPKMLPQFGEAIGKTVKGLRDNMSDDSDKPDEQTKADPDKAVSSADPAKDDADSKSGS
jgi:Sec-independent protein translocase protein TatA